MTKIISISDEAYNELSKLKDGASFTKVIINLTKEKKKDNIMEFAGILDEEEGDKMLKKIMEERKIGSGRFR
jgi:predicted CopG family antitoxin